jgi:hypothetical protein
LPLEIVYSDSRESRSSVVLGLVLVDFVDRNGGVDNGWLDSLLLHNWLDGLVDVVMDVLTCNSVVGSGGMLGGTNFAAVLELCCFGCETILYMFVVAVLDVAVLNTGNTVAVLLWENLPVLNGLNRGVVMILMDLTINGGSHILLSSWCDLLVLYRRVDSLDNC